MKPFPPVFVLTSDARDHTCCAECPRRHQHALEKGATEGLPLSRVNRHPCSASCCRDGDRTVARFDTVCYGICEQHVLGKAKLNYA